MTEEVRLGVSIRLLPDVAQVEEFDVLFAESGELYAESIRLLKKVFDSFERVPASRGVCSHCGKERDLEFLRGKVLWCGYCFKSSMGRFSVQQELVVKLRKKFPAFSERLTSYYNPLFEAVASFQGYVDKQVSRLKERDVLLSQLKKDLAEGRADYTAFGGNLFLDWVHWKKLRKAQRDVNIPASSALTVQLWKGLKFEGDFVSFDHPKKKGVRLRVKMCLGEYQKKYIVDALKRDYVKDTYPTLSFLRGRYFLLFPYRKTCKVSSGEELLKECVTQHKTVICVSFGVEQPITALVFQSGVQKELKLFGDDFLWNRKMYFDDLDKAVKKKIHLGLNPQRNRRQLYKWWRKTEGTRRRCYDNAVNRWTHEFVEWAATYKLVTLSVSAESKVLTSWEQQLLEVAEEHPGERLYHLFYQRTGQGMKTYNSVVSSLEESGHIVCDSPVIVLRDLGGIKSINLPTPLARVLSKWSVGVFQAKTQYKSYLRDVPVYFIPHRERTQLICSLCAVKDKGKLLTRILRLESEYDCVCGIKSAIYVADAYNLHQVFQSHLFKVQGSAPMGHDSTPPTT